MEVDKSQAQQCNCILSKYSRHRRQYCVLLQQADKKKSLVAATTESSREVVNGTTYSNINIVKNAQTACDIVAAHSIIMGPETVLPVVDLDNNPSMTYQDQVSNCSLKKLSSSILNVPLFSYHMLWIYSFPSHRLFQLQVLWQITPTRAAAGHLLQLLLYL